MKLCTLITSLLLSQLLWSQRLCAQAVDATVTESQAPCAVPNAEPTVVSDDSAARADALNVDPEAQAQRLRALAASAFDQNRFQQARALFSGAFAIAGDPELLYHIGLAADAAGDTDGALDAFDHYLRVEPTGELRPEVEVIVAGLRARRVDDANRPLLSIQQAPRAGDLPQTQIAFAQQAPRENDSALTEKWWFWTLIGGGALLLAGGVAIAVAASQDRPVPAPSSDRVSGVGVVWALSSF